ncbi:MAG: hypothetical protein OEY22_11790 [Candidatus Bathyarchaeota archaeon]|nr:hypothetical protein [Candidatus Bathyarchaeota archaeon]MDH5786801.1 hypothetical protein [Candidatus Bathyarchaeota archaeon]
MNNPTEKEVVKAKIENGEVKVKGREERRKFIVHGREYWLTKRQMLKEFADHSPEEQVEMWESAERGKTAKKTARHVVPKTTAECRTGTIDEEKVLAWMKEKGGKEISSTAIRDAFGFKNRAAARRVMRALQKAGKVRITETSNGKRKQYAYKLVT